MPTDSRSIDAELNRSPGEQVDDDGYLLGGDALLVEISLGAHQEVSGRVVVSAGVTDGRDRPAFVHVAVGINYEMVCEVGPAPIVDMEALVVSDPGRGVAVRIKDSGRVVNGHPLDRVVGESAGCYASAPGGLADGLYIPV